tara:strand:- start:747 stop:2138 length:1392 start_codon:yes stop_codon:yes gene_type:complete
MSCVIASPASGNGKTLLSILLSSWARKKGYSIQTFKVGPDYLDPQQLKQISQKPCRNLDKILCGSNWVRDSFHFFGGSAELTLVEGVMGLFDGIGSSSVGSTADIAQELNLPIVLILNANGQAASIAALINGFKNHTPKINLAGVVLNQINSKRHKELLSEVALSNQIRVLGYIFKNEKLTLSKSDLGLSPAHEIINLDRRIDEWAEIAAKSLDIDYFLSIMKSPKPSENPIKKLINNNFLNNQKLSRPIAIAKDEAFHFIYEETNDLLKELQIPILEWKIMEDEPLPKGAKGIIIPGGFPETHAEQLSKSKRSLNALKSNFNKIPIYAECGGMLLLGQSIKDKKGVTYPMTEILPFKASNGSLNVGYRDIRAIKNSLIMESEERIKGHEFHRWKLSYKESFIFNQNKFKTRGISAPWEAEGWLIKRTKEGWSNELFHASWIHLHWASNPKIATRISKKMRNT